MRCKVLWQERLGSTAIANASKISATGNKGLFPTSSKKTQQGNSGDHGQMHRDSGRQDSCGECIPEILGPQKGGRVDLTLALYSFLLEVKPVTGTQILLGKANHVTMPSIKQKWIVGEPWCLVVAIVTKQIQLWMV